MPHNKVVPSGSSQPSSLREEQEEDQVTAFTPGPPDSGPLPLPARLPPSDRPPASASATLEEGEASTLIIGPSGSGRGKQLAFGESPDSYEGATRSNEGETRDKLVAFSQEEVAEESIEEDEDEDEGDDGVSVDQVAARREARRVSHAPTHTLLGPQLMLPASNDDEPSAAAAGGLFQGFLESLGVAASGPSSQQLQPFGVATSAASAVILRATSKLHELALGDDHAVHDRWDDYDDETGKSKRGSAPSSRRGSASGSRRGSTSGSTSGSRRGSVSGVNSSVNSTANTSDGDDGTATPVKAAKAPQAWAVKAAAGPGGPQQDEDPSGSIQSAYGETYEDVDAGGKPPAPTPGFVYEHATLKVLLWYYLQTLLYSGIVAAVSIPMVTIFSSFRWHIEVEVPVGQEGIVSPIQPNHPVFQWMMLFWIANPLTLYCPLLLACIKRSVRLPWQLWAVVAFTLGWGVIVCTLFYVFDVPYWYWYLDLFIVLAAYIPCMCAVGWFVDEEAKLKDRLWDIAFTATLETVVAAATLLYCFFLMPLFYAQQASWQKLLWLCTIHPLYFELTTGFIVRKALHRNSVLGRTNIMYFLTIVHGMAHQVSITTMLQASVEPTRILAVTVLVYNASKLFWRSTVIHRHLLFDRILKGWSFSFNEDERTELARMVSVHVLTEVVLENASILVTPYLMYRMYKEPLFMMVVPQTFHATGGAYPAATMLVMILTMLSITVFFDVLFWFLNYHVLQFLPLINTWRRIKRAKGWYLCFLIYASIFMGSLFVFLIMMLLPRGTYCKSDEYCDCVTSAYEQLCMGKSFTLHHDYLVDINPSTYV